METTTAPPVPPPSRIPVRPPRRRLRALAVLLLAVLFTAGVAYQRQITSWLTSTVGPPERKTAFVPFAADSLPDLRLAIVGDVGDGGDLEWRLAATMYVSGRNDPYDALLLLGDNVYPYGDPSRLDEYVFQPFASVLDTGADLYAITGNHDALAEDGGRAQLDALGMPDFWWSARIGDVLLVGLDSNQADSPEQLAWLEATLESAESGWVIVAVHHPPYSAGYQGSDHDVREAFSPLFERYGVSLVLSGHEHDYQRSESINGVTYLISGGGAGTRRTGDRSYTAYSASTMNFVDLNIFDDRLVGRAIDHEFAVFDEFTITR